MEKRANKRGKNGNPNPANQFKPGNPGGPGRRRLSGAERLARDASRLEIAETWLELKGLPVPELTRRLKSKTAPGIEVAMCSAILTAIETGDLGQVFRFYERLLGKPRQAVSVTRNAVDFTKLTDEQLDRIVVDGEDLETVLLSGLYLDGGGTEAA